MNSNSANWLLSWPTNANGNSMAEGGASSGDATNNNSANFKINIVNRAAPGTFSSNGCGSTSMPMPSGGMGGGTYAPVAGGYGGGSNHVTPHYGGSGGGNVNSGAYYGSSSYYRPSYTPPAMSNPAPIHQVATPVVAPVATPVAPVDLQIL
jgi:hypothetical protein